MYKSPHPVFGIKPEHFFNAPPASDVIHGTKVPARFLGGLLKKAVDYFFPKLPKAFRKFVEKHKDEEITSIEIYRSPLDKVSNTFLQAITAGQWDKIKEKSAFDKLYHVYAIINKKYIYEKQAVPVFKNATAEELNRPTAESLSVSLKGKLTIEEFVAKAIKERGEDYFGYDGFKNNCQGFLIGSLQGSGLASASARDFLYQDTEKLVENTPAFSKYLGKDITDLAGAGQRIYSEIVDKQGGIRKKKFLC
jgi:hypothetical protein